jgi:ARG/rhodanese/phosphatase superfamily protein
MIPTLTIGEPDVAGPLAVFPVFGPAPTLEYVSYAEASARGVTITELPSGASVNDLLVTNPLDEHVLLYEGEELIGAQQNRTVDVAFLVKARSKQSVPVSCVERGRWDGRRHHEPFAPSPQAAFPALRAAKSMRIRERMAAGMEARADQGEVWQAVDAKLQETAAASPTAAMSDAFSGRRRDVDELLDAIKRRDGQCGAVAAIGGRIAVLDYVSRADAFAALFGPLVRGYALDALNRGDAEPPSAADVESFLARLHTEPLRQRSGAGLGTTVAFDGGTGLIHGDELIQACAYAK